MYKSPDIISFKTFSKVPLMNLLCPFKLYALTIMLRLPSKEYLQRSYYEEDPLHNSF